MPHRRNRRDEERTREKVRDQFWKDTAARWRTQMRAALDQVEGD
jgi:hypothetical protein